ncbi:uncharacterized protein LOC111271134 [Varroa jacobsoni]|uniref:Uncharacterized protein n=1 Tax=Varroa destructor TaxID=109461 RepID=A0A7M7M6G8_VARDE|nr:keratin, type I cytoskeletal 9-like [Varroa destructor]XP_022707466.1 uncharacterized protein LOC111271134 [Varroa jacobsoni]
MKFLIVIVCLTIGIHAGFPKGSGQDGGFSGGFGRNYGGGFSGSRGGGGRHSRQQQKGAILLVKQSPDSHRGGAGRSLTVSGPTHVVRTIHHIQRVDNGGQVLVRSGGSSGKQSAEPKYLLLIKTDQASHGRGVQRQQRHMQQRGGW